MKRQRLRFFSLREKVLSKILILVCLLIFTTPIFANSTYPLDSPKKEAQFNHLLKDLRCLVCQNQDLAEQRPCKIPVFD